MTYRAFLSKDDKNYLHELVFYHNPSRWALYQLEDGNPAKIETNWSQQIKFFNSDKTDVSDDIKRLPNTTGGIYIFELKGITIPFMENYILYIGRCQYTNNQNIRKRAREYLHPDRDLIEQMFRRWADYIYYRYCPDTDNERIKETEQILISSILPQYNSDIPQRVIIENPVSAF